MESKASSEGGTSKVNCGSRVGKAGWTTGEEPPGALAIKMADSIGERVLPE